MSNDFSQIMAAMTQVPDIDIDPATGATIGYGGGTLGQKYSMDKLSPKMKEAVNKSAEQILDEKSECQSLTDAYRDMMGVNNFHENNHSPQPTNNNEEPLSIEDMAKAELLAEAKKKAEEEKQSSRLTKEDVVQDVETLNEQHESNMMDMYIQSFEKKLNWRK